MSRTALGEFEHHVMLALVRLGGRSRGAPIVLELESATRRAVSPDAVFVLLGVSPRGSRLAPAELANGLCPRAPSRTVAPRLRVLNSSISSAGQRRNADARL